MGDFQSVGIGGKVEMEHMEDGVRVIDKFTLYEVSLLSEPSRPELGVYPIEFVDGKPRYTVDELAAIWEPALGAECARRYAEQTYSKLTEAGR